MSVDLRQQRSMGTRTSGASTTRLPSWLYVFTITALTAFLVELLLWGRPVVEAVVSAELGCAVAADSVGPAATGDDAVTTSPHDVVRGAVDRLVSLGNIRRAISTLAESSQSGERTERPVVAEDRLALRIQKRLRAHVDTSRSGAVRIQLSCRGPDTHWLVALLDQLAREFLLEGATVASVRPTADDLGLARWRVDEARHYERKARLELEDLLGSLFATCSANGPFTVEQATFQADAKLPTPPINMPRVVPTETGQVAGDDARSLVLNPQWSALQSQLTELTNHLDSLLEQFTPNHPEVQALTLKMQDIQRTLEATPKYHAAEQTSSAGIGAEGMSAGSDGGGARLPLHEPTSATPGHGMGQDVIVTEYTRMLDTYHAAMKRREQAEAALWQRVDQAAAAPLVGPVQARWMAMPPTVVRRYQSRTRPMLILLFGVVAMAVGVGTSWLTRSARGQSRINAVDDISRMTRIPVIGQLSLDPAPCGVERIAARARLMRRLTIGCEIVLTLILVLFVWGLFTGSTLSVEFVDDPLAVFVDTVVRACWFWR